MRSLCNDWMFTPAWSEAFAAGEGGEAVRLPHTVKEIPLHYADHESYQMVAGYRRELHIGPELLGKRLFLQFDGAAHIATVYVNGVEAAHHRTGYTAFRVEITDLVHPGDNTLSVKLDTTENPEVPPFGFVIDYLTYGGLYREVWLDVRERSFLSDIFVTTPTLTQANIRVQAENAGDCTLDIAVTKGGRTIAKTTAPVGKPILLDCPGAKPWNPDHPRRYICRVTLRRGEAILDVQQVKFGFRTVHFKADGFYLNGKKTFLRGLNRHQCYPYMGYAAPESLQREDARILKEELACTAVRTSHYPQSHHFIDECDRLGLLVFTEIPGWQHIGGEGWKEQALENVKQMVLQYRNHPSIVLWGVRINESQDDDELYIRANEIAHELDDSRPTSGVRFIKKSHLYEDVYAFNDFSHTGANPGVEKKSLVTPDMKKPLLISEHNGHMFPTKAFDPWSKRQEHALRHARVQNDAAADGEHVGCFGWCMFDYPTHKDFGSGDRVCYHGVLDAFRNPKTAAYAYASQGEKRPVLAVASPMDIGDYPGGVIGDVAVFTNCDKVKLYKNDVFVTEVTKTAYPALPHGPLTMDDTVGCLLETQEGFDKAKADLLRSCLLTLGRKGLAGMNPADYARMGWAMARYGIKFQDAYALYGKYVGNWGGAATVWRLDGEKDGAVAASVTLCPSAKLHLELTPSKTDLAEGNTYDMAAVRIRVLDENGNLAPYAQLPLELTVDGPAELVGPRVIVAEGGMAGTYLKTRGLSGKVRLTVRNPQTGAETLEFIVK